MATYLGKDEIESMAEAAFTAYEHACCWRRAGEAAREYALDDISVRATSAQIGLAVRLAQVRWQSATIAAKRNAAGA